MNLFIRGAVIRHQSVSTDVKAYRRIWRKFDCGIISKDELIKELDQIKK